MPGSESAQERPASLELAAMVSPSPTDLPRPDVVWVPVVPALVLSCRLWKASFPAELLDSLPGDSEMAGDVRFPPGPSVQGSSLIVTIQDRE
jgi:hypothetical protein